MQKEINWLLKEKYFGKPTKQFYKDVKRLEAGEPVDYVIGFTMFLGCKIDLSKKPLIPRPETEFWVQQAINDTLTNSSLSGCTVLDMFAGSGCIGLALLKQNKKLLCDFADSQPECLKQAKINCKINGIDKKRYRIIKSNIFSSPSLRGAKRRSNLDSRLRGNDNKGCGNDNDGYDFIFANPPYIPTGRKNKIQNSVLKYEPNKALFGGADGMFFIKKFLSQAKNHLNQGGKIYMEFDSQQKSKIEKLIKKNKYSGFEFFKDQYNEWRWVVIS